MKNTVKITIEATVNASTEKVWEIWTNTGHITKWNTADPAWHSPGAEHDLVVGGAFNYRMEAKDGSLGFDFSGTFTAIDPPGHLEYVLGDHREVRVDFLADGDKTRIVQTFDAETENPVEMQKEGWQAILNNFKAYTENN